MNFSLNKKSWFSVAALVLLICMQSQNASALIDGQVLAGKRWYTLSPDAGDDAGFAAQQATLSLHLDPIPLVPVAFGAYGTQFTYDGKDLGPGDDWSGSGLEVGVEVMAWVPLVPFFTPYAKVGYALMSVHERDIVSVANQVQKKVSEVSGYSVAVGGKFSLIPLVSILIEAGKSMQSIEDTEVKVNGLENADLEMKSTEYNSDFVLLGVMVGL